jgi:hypothetical protein
LPLESDQWPLYGRDHILRRFAHLFRFRHYRQLKHSGVLAFTQPREQHYVSTGKFERISMLVWTIIQMAHPCDAVRKLLPRKKRECPLVHNTLVEGQFGTGRQANRDHGLFNRGKPACN